MAGLKDDDAGTVVFWKWASLLIFCAQNSITPIVFRYGTTDSVASERASTAVILFCTESLKFILSFFLLVGEEGGDILKAAGVVHEDALRNPKDSLHLAVPAIIYLVQNALLQWSSGNLSAALWQVTYQGKILVTALFSVTLLKKNFSRSQWFSMLCLGIGIAVVQLSNAKESRQESMANSAEQSVVKGLVMLLLACCCSGFASVYTERIFKQLGRAKDQKKKSVWLQNMQLAMYSIILALLSFAFDSLFPSTETFVVVGAVAEAGLRARAAVGMFRGFTTNTVIMVVNNGIGGLLVALVIKHADNILRGFASAIATIVCAVMSVFCFGFILLPAFGLGTVVVVGSTLLYGGIVKLPGEWWNSPLELLAATEVAKTVSPTDGKANGEATTPNGMGAAPSS